MKCVKAWEMTGSYITLLGFHRRIIDTARTVCERGSMKRLNVRLSIRPSVCPIDRQQQRRAAGLLLSALRPGNTDRQRRTQTLSSNYAAARRLAANVGSVTLTADVRG